MSSFGLVPENLLPDGHYDERMYDLEYERHPAELREQIRYRVVRGFGNHIGFVARSGRTWRPLTVHGHPLDPHWWGSRQVAGEHLSHRVPLTGDRDAEEFRVD